MTLLRVPRPLSPKQNQKRHLLRLPNLLHLLNLPEQTYQQCREQRSAALKQYHEEQRVARDNRKAEAEAQRQRDLAQREANRKGAEVRAEQEKQERIAKKEAEKSSAESLATAHIDSLNTISKDDVAEILESGIAGSVSHDPSSFQVGFITKIQGAKISKDYRFKGEVECFDEWDDQVGRTVEVTGDVTFDTSGQMEYSFGSMQNVEQKKFAGTWVISQWNALEMGLDSNDHRSIVECRFDSLRIK